MSVIFVSPDRGAFRTRPLGLALAAASALWLAACGGDDAPMQVTAPAVTGATDTADESTAPGTAAPEDEPADDPASDRVAIAMTLEAVLTGTDPAEVCGDVVTVRYLREAYGGVEGCSAAQADIRPAKRVRVSRVVVLPDSVAQASAEPTGGIYDDERLRAELVLDDGVWKLDSLRSNVPVGP